MVTQRRMAHENADRAALPATLRFEASDSAAP